MRGWLWCIPNGVFRCPPGTSNSAPTAHGAFALLKPPSERTWHLTWCCLLQVHQGGPVGSGVSGQLGSRCAAAADGVVVPIVVAGPAVAVWWVLGYSRRGISPTLGDSACAAVRGCVLGYSQWGISLPLAAYSLQRDPGWSWAGPHYTPAAPRRAGAAAPAAHGPDAS